MVMAFAYLTLRQLSENWRVKVKHQMLVLRNRNDSLGLGSSVNNILDNLPAGLKRAHELKLAMQGKGATDEVLQPLKQQIWLGEQMLRFEPFLRLASPLLDRIGTRTLDRGFQFVERLLS